jgi:hypothetical protein
LGITLPGLIVKPSTQDAFTRRGVNETAKLRIASDKVMDMVLTDLIGSRMPPFPEQWLKIEEAAANLKAYGDVLYPCVLKLQKAHCLAKVQLDMHAEVRMERVVEADSVDVSGVRVSRQEMLRDRSASFHSGERIGGQAHWTPSETTGQRFGGGGSGGGGDRTPPRQRGGGGSSATQRYAAIPEEELDDRTRGGGKVQVISVEEVEDSPQGKGRIFGRASRDSGVKVT